MFVYTALGTTQGTCQTVLDSYVQNHPNVTKVNCLVSTSVTRFVNALTTWICPPVIKRLSPEISIVLGGLIVVVYEALYFVPKRVRKFLLRLACRGEISNPDLERGRHLCLVDLDGFFESNVMDWRRARHCQKF
jgi:hypothetical protein